MSASWIVLPFECYILSPKQARQSSKQDKKEERKCNKDKYKHSVQRIYIETNWIILDLLIE